MYTPHSMRLRGWYSTSYQPEPRSPRWYTWTKVVFTICTKRSNTGDETASDRITLRDQKCFTKTATLRGRTPTGIYKRFSLFLDVTLRTLVVTHRRFGKPISHIFKGQTVQNSTRILINFLSDTISQRSAVLAVLRQSTNTAALYQWVRTTNKTTISCTTIFAWQ
jgi:hypothetical protein